MTTAEKALLDLIRVANRIDGRFNTALDDGSCHKGITTREKCGACVEWDNFTSAITRANHALLASVREREGVAQMEEGR
jgi:hypothetical protein